MPSSADDSPGASSTRKRSKYSKRACQHCQRRKIKCDGKDPCEHCVAVKEDCVYVAGKARGGARSRAVSNVPAQPNKESQTPVKQAAPLPHLKVDAMSPVTSHPQPPQVRPNATATLADRVQWLEESVLRLNALSRPGDQSASAGPQSASVQMSARLKRPFDQLQRPALYASTERQSNRSGDDSGARSSERRAAETVYYGNSSTAGTLHTLKDKLCSLAPASSRTEAELYASKISPDPKPVPDQRVNRRGLAQLPTSDVSYPILALMFDDLMSMYPMLHAPTFYARYAPLWTADGRFSMETAQSDAYTDMEIGLLYAGMGAAAVLMREKPGFGERTALDPSAEADKWITSARLMLRNQWEAPTDLEQIQVLCFLTLYYFNVENEDLSYKLTGVASRGAFELGLHLRRREAGHPRLYIELRRRAFWCLYLLDRRTSVSLGRPPAIQDSDLDVDYPTPLDDELPFPEQLNVPIRLEHSKIPYLIEFVRFSSILGDVYEKVCGVQATWPPTEETARNLDTILEQWRFSLPSFLRFSQENLSSIPGWLAKQQLFLHLRGAHVRLLLLRPFVQDVAEGTGSTPLPGSFAFRMAELAMSLSSEIIHTIAQVKRSSDLIEILWYPAKQFLLTTVCIIFTCVLSFGSEPKFSAASCKADVRVALQTLKEFSYKSTGLKRNLRDVEFLRYMCNQAIRTKHQQINSEKSVLPADTTLQVAVEQQAQPVYLGATAPLAAPLHDNSHSVQFHPATVPPDIQHHLSQAQQLNAMQQYLANSHDLSFLNPFPGMSGDSSDFLMSLLDSGDREMLPTTNEFNDLSVAFS
ncbi:fungal-specific transcription factor domain-domain-containing protein [Protomyces lactucae-debilis]|uniref:Fungal-specific transcription factor domain-domain-containing protein n=1 Tax=Protomyces lactucae-debilis TaxID=2754530 RepID=A0A1Y2EZE7_PROLT|nr:fungal-specific transcription factor domain-containing protein [Protomyces lactucae-debilis]ORY76978.1 fungal-specific transcription factor domain-domain-containing protein [Protomyces lactucae-debilis]